MAHHLKQQCLGRAKLERHQLAIFILYLVKMIEPPPLIAQPRKKKSAILRAYLLLRDGTKVNHSVRTRPTPSLEFLAQCRQSQFQARQTLVQSA